MESIKKVLTAINCADVGTEPVLASVLQQHCKFAGLVFHRPWIPLHYKKMGHLLNRADVGGDRQVSEMVVNIETGAQLSETIGAVEELSTSHVELTMTGEDGERRRRQGRNVQQVTD